jgi:spore coat polysaccharide biosynthesis protein SpsF (cytidylyltransferase family)
MIERLKKSRYSENLVLATTKREDDDILEEISGRHDIKCFRGDEDNVLKRLVDAARYFGFSHIARLYGDSPLVDAEIVDRCVEEYLNGNYDLVTTKFNFPMGIDCEVVSSDCLARVLKETNDPQDLEHVTAYIWRRRDEFRGLSIQAPPEAAYPEYVLTVDDERGFHVFSRIIQFFHQREPDFKAAQVIHYLHENPHLITTRVPPRGF